MAIPTNTAIDLDLIWQQGGLLPPSQNPSDQLSDDLSEARVNLLSSLQTSLDVAELLALFRSGLSRVVNNAGISYSNPALNLQIDEGLESNHCCTYRLVIQREHLGEITLYRAEPFQEHELAAVELLMSALLYPMRNALLYTSALAASLTDALTGAGNRTALERQLRREIGLAKRYRRPLSLLVVDIDKFKQVNDLHGHIAGDQILQQLVATIRRCNRSTDLCFRYGGEEFVVLLSNTEDKGAGIIAHRLTEEIARGRVASEHAALQVSVSIGAASLCETDTMESLLNRADTAMYEAKRSGGNTVRSL